MAWQLHRSTGMHTNDEMRVKLLARRRRLLGRYRNGIERAEEELETHEMAEGDTANEQWGAHVLLELGEADARALAEVVGAIARIDAGTYGTCIDCGASIASLRLQVLPAAATCVHCAVRAELGGR